MPSSEFFFGAQRTPPPIALILRVLHRWNLRQFGAAVILTLSAAGSDDSLTTSVPRFGRHEVTLKASGSYANPYAQLEAEATLVEPDGKATRRLPLFWDGGETWRFRFSPDLVGIWQWSVRSADPGLNGRSGKFECVTSNLRGSIRAMADAGHHFQYQNGERMWFLGDTAWAYGMDSAEEKHDRAAAERYAANRANQGFNAIHLMLLGEIGWGNRGGPPWHAIAKQEINPDYFREIEERVAFANSRGLVTGLVLAWAIKGHQEPYAWSRLPDIAARERYARYATARFGAYHVYFIVTGEWTTAVRWIPAPEEEVRKEFIRLGDVVMNSDPQHRMIGIHTTIKSNGTVREFNQQSHWMSFGDYQQNYLKLHESILLSRVVAKPVINSEYAYWNRRASEGGRVNKPHSYTLADIRGATWDILMAGGYVVTGFGSTYLGGARNYTTFLPDDPDNQPWIEELQLIKGFFTGMEYWTLQPHDEWVTSPAPRTADRGSQPNSADIQTSITRVPATTYWCLANPGKIYVVYVRGTTKPIRLALPTSGAAAWRIEQFDPRTGAHKALSAAAVGAAFDYQPPDAQDWLFVVNAAAK